MKFEDDTAITDGDELTVLRLATVSPATTNTLFMEVRVHRITSTNWNLKFYNENEDQIWGGPLNMYNHRRWWYISLGNDNASLEQSMRAFVFDTIDKTITITSTEAWDFAGLNLRLFSNQATPTFFYSGAVAKIDLISGMYNLNDDKYKTMDRGLPNPIYLIDFTEPEHT